MKLLNPLVNLAIITLISLSFSACEKAANESCEQQDMNQILNCGSEKNVEVCCTTNSACVYKYNGIEYPDTEAGRNNLSDALGCNYKNSANYDEQKQLIIKHLIALKEKAANGVQ
jgi:hypothetical protein